MDTNTAAARMLSHPDDFFKHYPVQMAGGTGAFIPNVANLKTYYLEKKNPGYISPEHKEGHFGATRPGNIFKNRNRDISSFKMNVIPSANCSSPLRTHGVPMVNYNSNKDGKVNLLGNITAMNHYIVGAVANYMTTGLLTGCCFT